jgi:hypothetical protein
MQYYETIHTEDVNGFHIMCSITHEDTHPNDLFDDSIDDISEICRKIDNGTCTWFIARVEAFKGGILLGTSYLGGNLYDDPKDFVKDCNYEDMMQEAISEAKKNLEMLYTTRDEVTA